MSKIKEFVIQNKWSIILPILIFTVASVTILRNNQPSKGVSSTSNTTTLLEIDNKKTRFVDGNNWNRINAVNISEADKMELKETLLKSSLEVSIINNKPFLTPQGSIRDYAKNLDLFYSFDKNINIPLNFALRAADMMKKKMPPKAIAYYVKTISERLARANAI